MKKTNLNQRSFLTAINLHLLLLFFASSLIAQDGGRLYDVHPSQLLQSSPTKIIDKIQETVNCAGVTATGGDGVININVTAGNIQYIKIQKYNPYQEWWVCNPWDTALSTCGAGSFIQPNLLAGTYIVEVSYDNNNLCYIQDIQVTEGSGGCSNSFRILEVTPDQTSAVVTYSNIPNATQYTIEWAGNVFTTSALSYTLTGLSPCNTYTVTITANCSVGRNSDAQTFTTTGNNCGGGMTTCTPTPVDITEGVLGDPNNLAPIPKTQSGAYSGNREVPTMKEMFGVNVKQGDQNYFKNMDGLTDIFSHTRVFHHMNKDYWINNNTSSVFAPPYESRGNLQLIVDANNVPVITSTDPNAKRIYYNTATQELSEENIGTYDNPYENYMNTNWHLMKAVYDKFQTKIQATLVLVPSVFPAPQNLDPEYQFPYGYWKQADWGGSTANIIEAASAYAKIFARTYAPTAADCSACPILVGTLEMYNEAWGEQDPTVHHAIIEGFINGIEAYYASDPTNKIELLTGAFQAYHLENDAIPNSGDASGWKDYQGTRIPYDKKCYLNGTNYHPYPNDWEDEGGTCFNYRLVAYPEKTSSNFLHMRNAWHWNEKNMPAANRNIYVSEYGWDSETPNRCGGQTNCNYIGVGEPAQGVYLTRSTLMLARWGTYRAQAYEVLDEDEDPLNNATLCYAYHSSGIWNRQDGESVLEKASTKVLRKFMNILGNTKFYYAIEETDNGAYAFVMKDATTGMLSLVAWSAKDVNGMGFSDMQSMVQNNTSINLTIDGQTYSPNTGENWYHLNNQFSGSTPTPITANSQVYNRNTNTFTLTPIPVVIPLTSNGSNINCSSDYSIALGSHLTGVQSMDATYETNGIIESVQTINSSATVSYDSGTSIALLPNFEALAGVNFYTFIDGCNENFSKEEPPLSKLIPPTKVSPNATLLLYPNPTKNQLQITYQLGASQKIRLLVMDIYGKKIQEILTDYKAAGSHTQSISLRNFGKTGIYQVVLYTQDQLLSKKVVLLE